MTGKTKISLWGPVSGLGALVAVLGFAADRLHKWWMLDIFGIAGRGRVEVASFFDLVLAWNKGVSYGLFQAESTGGRFVLIMFALGVVFGLGVWLARSRHWLIAVAIGLIVGGALGNIFDRLVYGAVADFFSFHAFGFYWYIFNVADVWIVMGVVLIALESVFPGAFGRVHQGEEAQDRDA